MRRSVYSCYKFDPGDKVSPRFFATGLRFTDDKIIVMRHVSKINLSASVEMFKCLQTK